MPLEKACVRGDSFWSPEDEQATIKRALGRELQVKYIV